MKYIIEKLKKEKVMTISFALAIVSMIFVNPDESYVDYIDFRVLAILFSLMLLIKCFQSIGLVEIVIAKLFGSISNSRTMCQILIFLSFFVSMVMTNDVALITFVPLAIITLEKANKKELMIKVIVFQTVAANLGSMLTPIGNPQNLYLFSVSNMSIFSFFGTMIPITFVSFLGIYFYTMTIKKDSIRINVSDENISKKIDKKQTMVLTILLLLNMLVVLRMMEWGIVTVLTIIGVMLIRKEKELLKVDYCLLFTFIGFFIFVGNMGRVEFVNVAIGKIIQGQEILVAGLFSQFFSNVPTAILLSGFTTKYRELLLGTNVGGLGTMIASMASLISYKLYCDSKGADKRGYFSFFTVVNVIGFILLMSFSLLWYS